MITAAVIAVIAAVRAGRRFERMVGGRVAIPHPRRPRRRRRRRRRRNPKPSKLKAAYAYSELVKLRLPPEPEPIKTQGRRPAYAQRRLCMRSVDSAGNDAGATL